MEPGQALCHPWLRWEGGAQAPAFRLLGVCTVDSQQQRQVQLRGCVCRRAVDWREGGYSGEAGWGDAVDVHQTMADKIIAFVWHTRESMLWAEESMLSIFSARVIRLMASSTRASSPRDALQKAIPLYGVLRHGFCSHLPLGGAAAPPAAAEPDGEADATQVATRATAAASATSARGMVAGWRQGQGQATGVVCACTHNVSAPQQQGKWLAGSVPAGHTCQQRDRSRPRAGYIQTSQQYRARLLCQQQCPCQ